MKKQISVQNFSDEVAIISTPPGVAKSESGESGESGEPSDSMFPRAAKLCIVHYALAFFKAKRPTTPTRSPHCALCIMNYALIKGFATPSGATFLE